MPSHYNVMNENIGIDNTAGTYFTVLNLGTYAGIGGADRTQIAFPYQESLSDTDMYIRTAKAKTWRPWRKIVHSGNINSQTPTFTMASRRSNITSGESLSALLGKISKWFSDLKTVAFSGSYKDLSNRPTIPEIDFGTISWLINTGAGKLYNSYSIKVKVGTHYLYHTHIEANNMYVNVINKWIDIFTTTNVPPLYSQGIIRISDTGQLVEGLKKANVRFYGGNIQVALPAAILSNYNITMDLFAHTA